MWDRADLLAILLIFEFTLGRFEACEELLPEAEAVARRAGHHGFSAAGIRASERAWHAIGRAAARWSKGR